MSSSPAPAHHQPVLPAAVRRHVERANAIAAEVYKKDGNAPTGEPAPAAAPHTEPAPGGTPPSDSLPEGAGTPPSPEPAPSSAPSPTSGEGDSWEHKYRVLQGKYNAEVPRLQRQLQEQGDQLRTMQQQLLNTQTLLSTLNSQRSTPATPQEQQPTPASTRLVRDEEVEQFGSDLYDFIQRAAREATLPEIDRRIAPAVQRVQQVEQATTRVASSVAKSAEERTLDYLAEHVPDWVNINVDERFVAWLQEIDPYSGAKRHDLLKRAYASYDGPRVVAFFKGFLNENAVVEPTAPTPTPAPAPQPAQGQPGTQGQLQQLVAPGAPRGTTGAPTEAGKRVWTQQEVGDLYRKMNEYTKRGRPVPDELRSLERDLFKAQTEGRVRP